ncbi:MAG: helix-turn-helix transcriptional regulator [Planctomycetaceae bacterium]|nr:helix-turn-helix transcriptional regulator [Planctomycetaceae bacterium]
MDCPTSNSLGRNAVTGDFTPDGGRDYVVVANGEAIRQLRIRLGLTQAELAARAGFSDRLIRKAERGDRVRRRTLHVLAQALSTPDQIITTANLQRSNGCSDVVSLLTGLFGAAALKPDNWDSQLRDNITLECAGDPKILPYAGIYKGIRGCERFRRKFSRHLGIPTLTLGCHPDLVTQQGVSLYRVLEFPSSDTPGEGDCSCNVVETISVPALLRGILTPNGWSLLVFPDADCLRRLLNY